MKNNNSKEKLHTVYKNKDGVIIPGVTTVIDGLGWNKHGLIGWARKMVMEGKDPLKVRDKAADIGTIAHYLIHCELTGEKPDLTEYSKDSIDKAENCFIAFLDFIKDHSIETLATEVVLINEAYQYGGTLDWVVRFDGIVSLFDFKSSSNLYPEHKIQLAAYGYAWNDLYSMDNHIKDYHLLILGKEDGSFHHHYFNFLTPAFEVFKHLRAIYDLKNKL